MRLGAYSDVFHLPGVGPQAAAGLVAQVTQGAAGVGLILVVRRHTGSLPLAGGVVGALSIAAGLARPIQGRVIDRRGAAALTAACGTVHAAAIIGIVGLAHIHAPGATLVLLGALAGFALPPVSTTMRVSWGAAVAETERTSAYSLVYLTQQLSVLGGPLLLSGLIALSSASLAMVILAALAGAGTLAFAVSLARHPEMRSTQATQARGRVFANRGMRVLVALAGLTGAVIGALEVGAPTIATAHRAPAAAGLLIAALAVGGIGGAAVYGARRWTAAPAPRLLLLTAGMAVCVGLTVASTSLVLVGGLLFLTGIALNPTLTTISVLVDSHVAPASAAEAFGWLSFGIAGGTGAASGVAGVLTHGSGRTAFVVGAVAAGAALLLTLWAAAGSRIGATPNPGIPDRYE